MSNERVSHTGQLLFKLTKGLGVLDRKITPEDSVAGLG
jgi:hypothetical protein